MTNDENTTIRLLCSRCFTLRSFDKQWCIPKVQYKKKMYLCFILFLFCMFNWGSCLLQIEAFILQLSSICKVWDNFVSLSPLPISPVTFFYSKSPWKHWVSKEQARKGSQLLFYLCSFFWKISQSGQKMDRP